MSPTPEQQARKHIDELLIDSGWQIQDFNQFNLSASLGLAIREFPTETGHADYVLFVDKTAVGAIEAKPIGTTLGGVAEQTAKYIKKFPKEIPHIGLPLYFAYESTGIETYFRDERDPEPRSRRVFSFHKPQTLYEWINEKDTLRTRLQNIPELDVAGLWPCQIEAIEGLEKSFKRAKPRALIQMATGSGKTLSLQTLNGKEVTL